MGGAGGQQRGGGNINQHALHDKYIAFAGPFCKSFLVPVIAAAFLINSYDRCLKPALAGIKRNAVLLRGYGQSWDGACGRQHVAVITNRLVFMFTLKPLKSPILKARSGIAM
jgi:hypothetical protein